MIFGVKWFKVIPFGNYIAIECLMQFWLLGIARNQYSGGRTFIVIACGVLRISGIGKSIFGAVRLPFFLGLSR